MRNIKLVLQYDGTCFSGYELQPRKRTIRGEIEKALLKVFGIPVKVTSSSRTDAGAHALGLVVNFKVDSRIPTEKISPALNSCLPSDLKVAEVEEVDENFSARFNARRKEYQYLVYNGEILPPYLRHYVWQVKEKLNLTAMRKVTKFLVGKHDFSSFCASGGDDKDFVRTIYLLTVKRKRISVWENHSLSVICFSVVGDGFLYKMVRNIVGTLVEVGLGKISPLEVKKILNARNRKLAGRTAPAQGLWLVRVDY